MRAVLCCLVLFFSYALATDFTCSVQYRNSLMKNGYVSGNILYTSTAPGRMLFSYPPTSTRSNVTELYEFNGFNGYNGKSTLPYANQLGFTTGTSCACETTYVDYALPLLAPDSTTQPLFNVAYSTTGAKDAQGCTIYTLRASMNQTDPVYTSYALGSISFALTEVHLNSQNLPCYASFTNGKQYTFSSCKTVTTTAASFPEPSGCKCGKPLDIAIVLDRSGSISYTEFTDEKGFVVDFTSKFTYGPLQANLAIINFNSIATVALAITDGVSKANVDNAVNSLQCPKSCDDTNGNCWSYTSNTASCCCCCGTCIACGMQTATAQLALGRAFAFKLLIVVTDGYGNHVPSGNPSGSTSTSCNSANNGYACDYALSTQLNNLYAKVGGPSKVATYAIGVGSDRDVSMGQLTIVAGNQTDHVLRRADFAELANNNVELIARACDENPNPCGGCCGFCSCGKCESVDGCDPTSPCNPAAVPPAGVCCANVPTDCTNTTKADPCNTYTCDDNSTSATAGKCVVTSSVECGKASNTTCFTRACVKATGLCKTSVNDIPACASVKECTADTVADACDDNNLCTTETCTVDGACVWTQVNCSATLTPNKCQNLLCSAAKGCYLDSIPDDSCDDNNNCTIDFCDPKVGCSHTNVTCDDGDPCTTNLCDHINGCMFVPVVCGTNVSDACNVGYCEKENGTCAIRVLDCTQVFPTTIVIASSLTAAAIVGIVIAAVLCAAGVAGGGAYAYANAGAGGNASAVANNPLYVGNNMAGANPLYKHQ